MSKMRTAVPVQHFLQWFRDGQHHRLVQTLPALVEAHPDEPLLWKLLGASQLVCGQRAAEALGRAAALDPQDATNWRNLGLALSRAGDDAGALTAWNAALECRPDDVSTWSDLGLWHQARRRLKEAVSAFERAHALRPQAMEHCRLAEAWRLSGEPERGLEVLSPARTTWPEHPEVWLTAGNLHWSLAHWGQAVHCYRQALHLTPDHPQAHANLGDALKRLGQHSNAVHHLTRAVELAPHQAGFVNALGSLHAEAWRLTQAQRDLQQAVALQPGLGMAWCNLGNVMRDLGEPEQAQTHYDRALELDPDDLASASNQVLLLNYHPGAAPEACLKAARDFDALLQRSLRQSGSRHVGRDETGPRPASEGRALRVGLVSADFNAHPVGFFLADVLPHLSRADAIELVAFSNSAREDAVTARLKACFADWVSIHTMTDDVARRAVQAQHIDVLVDLSGHTAGHRLGLFARRAAPVQCTWLGYFGTTGLQQMDALLADRWTVPEELKRHYTERVYWLPHARMCMGDMPLTDRPYPTPGDRPLTWGCFNNLAKLNDAVFDCWAEVLRQRPDSRLLLKALQYDDAEVCAQVADRLARRGVPVTQLRFMGASPREAHLQAYDEVDISLDPFPFNGGTSTVDSLWMGVPVLTMAGWQMAARQGLGILSILNMQEWIASSTADYIDRAFRLAADVVRLREQRAQLRQKLQSSALMQPARFARDWAQTLHQIWADTLKRSGSDGAMPRGDQLSRSEAEG